MSCARAGVEEGMELLDLGCGWAWLTSWLAELPKANILAVSNGRACAATGYSTAKRETRAGLL